MHFTKLKTSKKAGFHTEAVYRKAQPTSVTLSYMREKTSFFIAAVSLVAFIGGNMVGQHGWYAFWKSVFGAADDSLITYSGMVTPVAQVPDYSKWVRYGGQADQNTFRQVPKDFLISLPTYDASSLSPSYYSVGYMGSYDTGNEGDGSHPGVDIRVPEGTPIRSIANGIVTRVANDAGGFGLYVVVRHPHVPDPDDKTKETVIFSSYSHLSAQYVAEGDIISKGQEVGLSGMTGDASGPHLHFQIDRESAPWHPFWPFSSADARNAGLSFYQAINKGLNQLNGYENTLNPLVYIQSNGTKGSMIAKKPTTTASVTSSQVASAAKQTREQRIAARKAKVAIVTAAAPVIVRETIAAVLDQAPAPAPVQTPAPAAVEPKHAAPVAPSTPKGIVSSVEVHHDGRFSGREWERVTLVLRDADGNIVQPTEFDRDLVLRTAYGEAEFKPATLTVKDFKDGETTVQMLPRGRRTVVIEVQPLQVIASPMKYSE